MTPTSRTDAHRGRVRPLTSVPGNRRNISPSQIALVAGWVCAVPLFLLAVLPGAGPSRQMSTLPGIAHLISFPIPAALLITVIVLTAAGAAVLRRRAVGRVPVTFLTMSPVVLSLIAAIGLALPPSALPWTRGPSGATASGGREFKVAVLNSQSTLSSDDIAILSRSFDPDVIILPEAAADLAGKAAAGTSYAAGLFEASDDSFSPYRDEAAAPTSVLVHNRVTGYNQEPSVPTTYGTVFLRSAEGSHPAILGLHAAPPLPGLMTYWLQDTARVSDFAERFVDGPLITAGDFNATLRHGPLAARTRMVDTAEQCGIDSHGTWPAAAMGLLRTPIDHIFVTPDIGVSECRTTGVGSGDHLAYLAVLRLP